eukprot:TRINITY_DN15916_c0_g2_i2.p1 TRINITY_DN15916_c0_g2~~TRINITY_DN15916_c0_g2_i2.p1  ORF type:complete len:225 (+),score=47.45 TRINITY_DN15916_c0_g2_i2:346-1020(+)
MADSPPAFPQCLPRAKRPVAMPETIPLPCSLEQSSANDSESSKYRINEQAEEEGWRLNQVLDEKILDREGTISEGVGEEESQSKETLLVRPPRGTTPDEQVGEAEGRLADEYPDDKVMALPGGEGEEALGAKVEQPLTLEDLLEDASEEGGWEDMEQTVNNPGREHRIVVRRTMVRTLPERCQNTVRMLLDKCQNGVRTLSDCSQSAVRIFLPVKGAQDQGILA